MDSPIPSCSLLRRWKARQEDVSRENLPSCASWGRLSPWALIPWIWIWSNLTEDAAQRRITYLLEILFFFLNSCFMWHVLPSLINSCITDPPVIHFEEELCEMTCKCLTLFRCLFSSKLITCRPSWCPKVLTSDLLVDSIHDFFFYDDRIYITWNLPFPLFLSVCSVTWRIFAWCGHHHHPSPETFHFSELKLYPPNSNFLVLSSLEPLASTHPSTFYV